MPAPRLRIFVPFRHRDFRLLALGSLTSLLGDGFFRVAIGIQVLVITGSAGALAAVAFAWAFGQVLSLPFGGWASDRFERRKVMILADLWRALAIGAMGVLSVTGRLELVHMLVLGALFGVGNGFFNPASTALLPQLVPSQDLPRANALLGVARPAALYIVGPLIGGAVVAATSAGVAFIIDAASFLVSAVMLALLHPRPVTQLAGGGLRQTVADVAAGLRFVRRNTWAWAWLVGAGLGTLIFHGPFDTLVPYVLWSDLNLSEGEVARTMSYILAAGGLGSIVALTLLGQWDLPRRFMTALYVCEAIGLAGLVGFGLMRTTWHALVAGLVLFTMFAVSDIIWTTTMQRLVPGNMLGRVASLDWLTSMSLAPASFVVAWLLEATVGAQRGLIVAGVAGAAVLLALLLVPGARDPERADFTPVTETAPARV